MLKHTELPSPTTFQRGSRTVYRKHPSFEPPMMDQDQPMSSGDDYLGSAVTLTGEIMVIGVIVLFILFLTVFVLYLRAKRYAGANPVLSASRRRPLVFALDQPDVLRRGLDPVVIDALPVTIFNSVDFKEGFECAVCLSDLTDGEKTRLLPKCNHGFHLECIDMWFHSNSTCPLCRSLVEIPPLEAVSGSGHSPGLPNLNANKQESSSSVGSSLVIEIPSRVGEEFPSMISPVRSSRVSLEGIKSPVLTRLRSLRRILSRGSGGVGSSSSCTCSPGGCDIEQGVLVKEGIQTPMSS